MPDYARLGNQLDSINSIIGKLTTVYDSPSFRAAQLLASRQTPMLAKIGRYADIYNPIISKLYGLNGFGNLFGRSTGFIPLSFLNSYASQIKYLDSLNPNLEIVETENRESIITDNNDIQFNIRKISDVVTLKQSFEDFSLKECIEFTDFLSEYPCLSLKHKIGESILNSICDFPQKVISNIDLFRVRRMEGRKKNPYVYREMFQAPYTYPLQGRFSSLGLNYLYFSSTLESALLETDCEHRDYTYISVKLVRESKVLDVTDISKPIFQYCHLPASGKSDGLNIEYLLPNFVSDCAKYAGLNGIEYKSVKMQDTRNYVFSELEWIVSKKLILDQEWK